MEPFQGSWLPTYDPGCAARPWASRCNPFGVKSVAAFRNTFAGDVLTSVFFFQLHVVFQYRFTHHLVDRGGAAPKTPLCRNVERRSSDVAGLRHDEARDAQAPISARSACGPADLGGCIERSGEPRTRDENLGGGEWHGLSGDPQVECGPCTTVNADRSSLDGDHELAQADLAMPPTLQRRSILVLSVLAASVVLEDDDETLDERVVRVAPLCDLDTQGLLRAARRVHDQMAQAAAHGRSTEAEVRDILARAVNPPERVKMGEALAQLGRRLGLTNADVEALEQTRDRTPAQPPRFHE